MNTKLNRRQFLAQSSASIGLAVVAGCRSYSDAPNSTSRPTFNISLAQWSFHRALEAGSMKHLDFAQVAKRDHGIEAVEYVNQFFKDKAKDQSFLAEMKRRADGEGVRSLLIMCDDEGALGDPDSRKRRQAVENHFKWADAAKFLGCHSIRVNAETNSIGSFDEQQKRASDGLRMLSEYCAKLALNTIVENHGHLSSNGAWLAGVMKRVNLPNCGTLPDFGNWDLTETTTYDRYKGVTELMPYAKAVSAKSHDFDAAGEEIHTDFHRMLKIVLDAGYHGYLGIEYEGERISETEGVRLTKRLLEKVRDEVSRG